MKNDNRILWIIGIIILAALFFNNLGFFGINVLSNQVQYYNKPIEVLFTTSNFTNPNITSYFNDKQLHEVLVYYYNETVIEPVFNSSSNQTVNESRTYLRNITYEQNIVYSSGLQNGTYFVKLSNLNQAGTLKIVASESNHTESQLIEVRKAFIDIKNNIINSVEKGDSVTLEIRTYNPQGETIEADSVDIDVYDPSNSKTNLLLSKSGNVFTKQFNYENIGTYQFKVHARKDGYDTKEFTIITSVVKSEGIHPIVYIWAIGLGLLILLFIIKMLRRKWI